MSKAPAVTSILVCIALLHIEAWGQPGPQARTMSATAELVGKLVILNPSHGSYWDHTTGSWTRAMRTLCGPNPLTDVPLGWTGSTYSPSDYYTTCPVF